MRNLLKRITCALFFIVLPVVLLSAEKTSLPNLSEYTLDNGLELFVVKNDAVPLVTIEISVRAGGIAQTPQNAGLFHLYEHMMFKGNTKYRTAADVQNVINSMGIPSWNGSTDIECVNYFFTVPEKELYKGLEFWNYAIREPLMDRNELEREKKVVLSEITGGYSNPDTIMGAATMRTMFPDAPWKLDSAGPADNVRNATVDDLRNIQQKYYVPNNTSLFVGGDVDPKQVLSMVKELYGSWKRAPDPWQIPNKQQSMTALTKTEYYVMPYDKISPQIAQIMLYYRGPDAEFNRQDTYAADVTGYLMQNPAGIFKKTMTETKRLMLPGNDYVGEGYVTRKESGLIQFAAAVLKPDSDLVARADLFLDTIQQKVIPQFMKKDAFTDDQYATIRRTLRNNRVYEDETASGLLNTLQFWWATADANYYYTYIDNMDKVGNKEVANFVEKYIADKKPLVFVLVNPAVYEKQKQTFLDKGYTVISSDNAFWWGVSK